MKLSKNLHSAFLQALGVFVYVTLVALIMYHAEQVFGQARGFIAPVAFLMLFVFSAAVVGTLVLGKPVVMYLDGHKREALQLFGYTLLWLFVFTVLSLLFLSIR